VLVGRQEGHPACKNWVVGCWRGYLSGARCRLAYGPADATATHRLFASVKSRLVSPFWYRLTRVVPDKGPLNGCVCVCVCNKLVRCCCVQKFVHELRITNQVMYLNPPVEQVRVNVFGELYSWEANILTLPRITHSRYQASCQHLVWTVEQQYFLRSYGCNF